MFEYEKPISLESIKSFKTHVDEFMRYQKDFVLAGGCGLCYELRGIAGDVGYGKSYSVMRCFIYDLSLYAYGIGPDGVFTEHRLMIILFFLEWTAEELFDIINSGE